MPPQKKIPLLLNRSVHMQSYYPYQINFSIYPSASHTYHRKPQFDHSNYRTRNRTTTFLVKNVPNTDAFFHKLKRIKTLQKNYILKSTKNCKLISIYIMCYPIHKSCQRITFEDFSSKIDLMNKNPHMITRIKTRKKTNIKFNKTGQKYHVYSFIQNWKDSTKMITKGVRKYVPYPCTKCFGNPIQNSPTARQADGQRAHNTCVPNCSSSGFMRCISMMLQLFI